MGHPAASCKIAANLLRSVWNSTELVRISPFEEGWYMKATKKIAELRPGYKKEWDAYTAHRDTCPVCGEALQELNDCHV